jgi:5-methylcytosine-specific restriction endonuclease McrA
VSEMRVRETWREADEQLCRLRTARGALDAQEAKWLVIARRERVHERFGFGSFREYVERRLGYQPHTAIDRIRVAEELETLPVMRAALAAGDYSYSAIREATRVATPGTEAAWVAAIEDRSVREVEQMVRGRKKGDLPETPVDPDLAPRRITMELTPEVFAMFREVRKALEEETSERFDDNAVMAELCQRGLRGGEGTAPTHLIALTVCERCKAATQDAAGRVVDVAASAVDHACCDAQHLGHLDAEHPERLKTDIPEPVRRLVWQRDHGRCKVPGCGASRYLEIHHLVWRQDGGDHRPQNLILICGAHHRAHHKGRLRIDGDVDRLLFTHENGSAYGTDRVADAQSALRNLGFKPALANAAVQRAQAHVGADASLQDFIKACLHECSA